VVQDVTGRHTDGWKFVVRMWSALSWLRIISCCGVVYSGWLVNEFVTWIDG
jgi:hypothetical protein